MNFMNFTFGKVYFTKQTSYLWEHTFLRVIWILALVFRLIIASATRRGRNIKMLLHLSVTVQKSLSNVHDIRTCVIFQVNISQRVDWSATSHACKYSWPAQMILSMTSNCLLHCTARYVFRQLTLIDETGNTLFGHGTIIQTGITCKKIYL